MRSEMYIGVTIDRRLKARLVAAAGREHRTISAYVRHVLQSVLEEDGGEHGEAVRPD